MQLLVAPYVRMGRVSAILICPDLPRNMQTAADRALCWRAACGWLGVLEHWLTSGIIGTPGTAAAQKKTW